MRRTTSGSPRKSKQFRLFRQPAARGDPNTRTKMTKLVFWALMIAIASCGCGQSITAPDDVPPLSTAPAEFATLTGRVYASVGPMYPVIGGAVIEINESDGASRTVVSGGDGTYRISLRRGSVTVTASKDGFEPKQWQFDLITDTALNFSLDQQ